jgi:uncharacterized membrane protein YtjA (UPF0391 family)
MKFLSTKAHSILDILVAFILILAPNIFGFSDNGGAAANIPRILGVALLLLELVTDNSFSLVGWISMKTHLATDYLAGLFLALSPWLFGFNNQGTSAWLPHLIVGVLIIGNAAVTRSVPDHRTSGSRQAHA